MKSSSLNITLLVFNPSSIMKLSKNTQNITSKMKMSTSIRNSNWKTNMPETETT